MEDEFHVVTDEEQEASNSCIEALDCDDDEWTAEDERDWLETERDLRRWFMGAR